MSTGESRDFWVNGCRITLPRNDWSFRDWRVTPERIDRLVGPGDGRVLETNVSKWAPFRTALRWIAEGA